MLWGGKPIPFACFLTLVRHPPNITVILVHALGHYSGTQPEAQNEVLQRSDTFNFILRCIV